MRRPPALTAPIRFRGEQGVQRVRIEDAPALDGVRCIGEVTDLHQNSTALYFTLTDGHAELPCMIWANHYPKMVADLGDGTEVILEADIDYWTEGGKIDLKPWEVVCC